MLRERLSRENIDIVTQLACVLVAASLFAGGMLAAKQGVSSAARAANAVTADEIFSRLVEQNHLRETRLQGFSTVRHYEVRDDKGKLQARAVVDMKYHAPSTKTFAVRSEEGSWVARHLVFRRLMDTESETAAGRNHRDSSITPENYTFRTLGEEDVDGRHCYLVEVIPKRKDKYLWKGKTWIDADEFAIVQSAGEPAKSPSFWVTHSSFKRHYQKVGDFWLPLKDVSVAQVKVIGTRVLTIDYGEYIVEGKSTTATQQVSEGNPH